MDQRALAATAHSHDANESTQWKLHPDIGQIVQCDAGKNQRGVGFSNNPILTPKSHPSLGNNLNGPSLIRVPNWVERPLGRYYLYFADHKGKYLRLAYADQLTGPWKVHAPGVLPLAESYFTDHVASPEVVVDEEKRQIRLYYHGLTPEERGQHTRVALSPEGLHFTAVKEPVGKNSAYWRLLRSKMP